MDRYIYHLDDFVEQEILPSTDIFIFPSSLSLTYSNQREEHSIINTHPPPPPPAPPRTSSSSSFLQETKQLLEMITIQQNTDLSKLVSEV